MEAASLHPDDLVDMSSGTPESCHATTTRVRVQPWDYRRDPDKPGNVFKKDEDGNLTDERLWILAVRIDYAGDDESGEGQFTDFLKLGKIEDFSPIAENGEEIILPENLDDLDDADMADYEGVAVTVGELNKKAKWGEYVRAAVQAGLQIRDRDNLKDFRFFEGMEGQYETVPMPAIKGRPEYKPGSVFVLQDLIEHHGHDDSKKKSTGKSSRRPGKAASKGAIGVKEKLIRYIEVALEETGELSRPDLNRLVAKNFEGVDVNAASKMIKSRSFWEELDSAEIKGKKIVAKAKDEDEDWEDEEFGD